MFNIKSFFFFMTVLGGISSVCATFPQGDLDGPALATKLVSRYEDVHRQFSINDATKLQALKGVADLGHGWAAFEVAQAYGEQGTYKGVHPSIENASAYYQKALEAMIGAAPPLQAEANCALGNIASEQDRREDAVAYYEAAVGAGCVRSQDLLDLLQAEA